MKRVQRTALIVLLAAGTLFFGSCEDFFSSSWGKARDYDKSKITVNAGNVDSWLAAAAGNPGLALVITEKIIDSLQSLKGDKQGTPTKDQIKLQEAGVNLAIEASGVGTSIVTKAGDLIDKIDSDDGDEAVKDILSKVQNDFASNNGTKAADNLSKIVEGSLEKAPADYGDSTKPQFCDTFADSVDASDASEAVMVLVLALFQEKGKKFNELDKLEDWNNGDTGDTNPFGLMVDNGVVKIDTSGGVTPDPKAVTLAAYLNLIAVKDYDNSIAKEIKNGLLGKDN